MIDYRKILKFTRDESGAVTVDWVVLTAAVVGLAAIGVSVTYDGTMTAASSISNWLINYSN